MATKQQKSRKVLVTPSGYLSTGHSPLDRRARTVIDDRVEEHFLKELFEWAAVDAGRLRTRQAIRLEIALELAAVIEALGPWAVVPPTDIFLRGVQADPLSDRDA